jgi:glycosidase
MASGRTTLENEAFDFVKKLANYRKNTSALQTGKLTQYMPKNSVYVYFRHDAEKTVMVIMSQNTEEQTLTTKRFSECMASFSAGKSILDGTEFNTLSTIKVPPMSFQVIELR